MRMAKILNTILCALIIFMLCFVWVVYCLKDTTIALALSLIVSASSGYLIWRAQTKRENSKKIKLAKRTKIATLGNYFRFGADNATLFEDMLRYYRFEVTRVDYDNLIVEKNGTKSFVAIRFGKDTLSQDELTVAVVDAKRAECSKLYVFANKVDKTAQNTANAYLHTISVDIANTYALFEQCDKLPALAQQKPARKSSFVAKYAFNKRRFGWYFAGSLFMLVISVISYFPWYTLSWATVNMGLAIYSLLNKRYNVEPTRVTLD